MLYEVITGTLLDELERRDLSTGLATLCIASGMGAATIVITSYSIHYTKLYEMNCRACSSFTSSPMVALRFARRCLAASAGASVAAAAIAVEADARKR